METARFYILMAVNVKITAFWDDIVQSSTLKMKVAGSSKTLATFYQTTRRHTPENSNSETVRCLYTFFARDIVVFLVNIHSKPS
jgi:hypothetical protein